MSDAKPSRAESRKSVVRVTIVGEEYSIRSEAPPEHTRAVARYVDQAIRKVLNTATVVESHKAAILAALQITDELFATRAAADTLADEIQATTAEALDAVGKGARDDAQPGA